MNLQERHDLSLHGALPMLGGEGGEMGRGLKTRVFNTKRNRNLFYFACSAYAAGGGRIIKKKKKKD